MKMLQKYSENYYTGFYELAQEIEIVVESVLRNNQLNDYLRYPESTSLLTIEEDTHVVFMYETPESADYDFYKLGRLTTYHPNSHTEKPSGIILADGSYLQMDFVFAHHLRTRQMYVMFFSIHYGRCDTEKKEFYFFRFDKESDYLIEKKEIYPIDYKPIYHFHGNADEPHFELTPFSWDEKFEYVIRLLGINLQRIRHKTGESTFSL